MHLGDWNIDEFLTFCVNTHDFTASGSPATDADAVPTYRVYEDETGAAIANDNMAKLDDANTTGFYSERLQLLAATGFELGKTYTIYLSATTNSVVNTGHHTFKIRSLEDMGLLYKGKVSSIVGGQLALTIDTPRSDVVDDYVGAAVIRDVTNVPSATNVQITAYDGAGVITLQAAATFTVAVGDIVEIPMTLALPTLAEFAEALLTLADVETGIDLRDTQRIMLAVLAGKSTGHENNNPKFRDPADAKNRVTATTNPTTKNRTAISFDVS